MAATEINKGGVSLRCGVWPFIVVWQHFFMWLGGTLKSSNTYKQTTLERFSSAFQYDGWLAICVCKVCWSALERL